MAPQPAPKRIGRYQLEEFLGGGMSHVYRARDTVIGRTVAVKVLTEAGAADPAVTARFLAEARMAGTVEHPNIISIYDYGEDEFRHPFIVMEFLRGENLLHAIQEGRTGGLANQLRTLLQVGRALEYIHLHKIVHRDIKPDNVFITNTGITKLIDFGIAKTEGLSITRQGFVLGTVYYMSPEQIRGQEATEQVDVYAFGILMFELVVGGKPFDGDSVERIFYSIVNEPLNLEPLRKKGAPPALCSLVERCTRKNPAERPQGLAPVCSELDRMISELDAPPPAPEPPVVITEARQPTRAPEPAAVITQERQPTRAPEPAAVITQERQPMRPSARTWLMIAGVALALSGAGYFGFKAVTRVSFDSPEAAVHKPAKPQEPPKTTELPKTISTTSGDMVLVPAGEFLLGEMNVKSTLPAFYIDKTEVTNGVYARFCRETNHKLPPSFPRDEKADYPVVNVTFQDAVAFATWAGKRLPTNTEWEKAARGTDGRQFPWGSETPVSSRANVGAETLRPATDFPEGASPYGALNMVGNAWEWVEQSVAPDAMRSAFWGARLTPPLTAQEPWYLARGFAFDMKADDEALRGALAVPARASASDLGFRCVKDPL